MIATDSQTTAPLVLQARKLRELRDMLGSQRAADFIQRFDVELAGRLRELEANGGSPAIVASIAHKLVGVAGAVGLDELATASQCLSAEARAAPAGHDLTEAAARVLAAGHRARAALAAHGT
jgi:HPt (histidine-containing phosphotransfer) domain-containing protein